ncbi:MAG: hypothetical protein HQM08_03960 [Candidatus Riflebacteria bacterium]|nr:hypothetical protein [Candidatus Riflebacteria bacterium]
MKKHFLLFWLILLCIFSHGSPVIAGSTMMVNGTWCGPAALGLVQAEIDGSPALVVLPRFEFKAEVNSAELFEKIKKEMGKQDAIFHLYHDGLGKPKRDGMKFFASDVFLKDLKMTYSGALRQWGYSFKVSPKPPFEEPDYIKEIESGAFLNSAMSGKGDKLPKPKPEENTQNPPKPTPGAPQPIPSSGEIKTSWDVMPQGVLPPAIRKMKEEINARLNAIKSKPYKFEKPKVDVVRWATGKMGNLNSEGRILQAPVEGCKLNLRINVPMDHAWLKAEMAKAILGQKCEYIFHRDLNGREAVREGDYILSDIYFTDLGKTWQEWIEENGLLLASETFSEGLATSPIQLDIKVVDGVWDALLTPIFLRIGFENNQFNLGSKEIIRFSSLKFPAKPFPEISKKLNASLKGQPVKISLIVSPDGKPYTELNQKRTTVVWFPTQNSNLQALLDKIK